MIPPAQSSEMAFSFTRRWKRRELSSPCRIRFRSTVGAKSGESWSAMWYDSAKAGTFASLSVCVRRFSFVCFGSLMSGRSGTDCSGMSPKYFSIIGRTAAGSTSPTTASTALFGA